MNALEDLPLAEEARNRLESIRPRFPDLVGWEPLGQGSCTINAGDLQGVFDSSNGSIVSLVSPTIDTHWADEGHPLGVLSYQTFSASDYERFFSQYILPEMQTSFWAREDFTKPGLELAKPVSRIWKPAVKASYARRTHLEAERLFRLVFDCEATARYGAPREVFLHYRFPIDQSLIRIELQWFGKPACRMPEAVWFGFTPNFSEVGKWSMDKLGRTISPLEVVRNGNKHLHAVGRDIDLVYSENRLRITPLDSPLVAPGVPSLLDFDNEDPDLSAGMNFCLLNNVWGTNFPMWFEEDCRFRFEIAF